jgi:hypothetical protein
MILNNNEHSPLKQTMSIDTVFARLSACLLILCAVTFGCTPQPGTHYGAHMGSESTGVVSSVPNDRLTLDLSPSAEQIHRAVMREHLEAVQEIVGALAHGDFSKAEDITKTQLGFTKHREAMRRQEPEAFSPAYHDLAMAHHEAAEELAYVIPSQDFKQILLKLDRTLEMCVACHRAFKL